MYEAHFGLRELPFGITPDTSFFFGSPRSQEALNTLLVAARGGEGFIKITGEVGTGKTLLCRKFMATLGEDFITAYIPNPYLEPRSLMLALADELELSFEPEVDQHQLLKTITHHLLRLANQDRGVLMHAEVSRQLREGVQRPGTCIKLSVLRLKLAALRAALQSQVQAPSDSPQQRLVRFAPAA